MRVEPVRVERHDDRRFHAADVRHERAPHLVARRVRQLAIAVAEQVQLVEADNRGGVSQFALATCGDLAGRAHGWIARLAALAPRRRHEHCVRAGAGALHRRSRAGKALVVWMREDEEEGGALGAHRRRLVTPGRFPFSMELGGLKGVGVRSRFSIPIEKSGSDPDLPGPRGLPG